MQNIHVSYRFENLNQPLEESIKQYVERNLYVNPESDEPLLKPYYKKIFSNKPEAKVEIQVNVERNKMDKFDGIFVFTVDGKSARYERTGNESFKNPQDLVNHAFTHFKHEVTASKGFFEKVREVFRRK